jgi:hypothetical protein
MSRRLAGNQAGRVELSQVCAARAGVKRGSLVAFRLTQWASVASWIGHFPSISEYAREAQVSIPTAERYRAAIRAAFSEDEFRSLVEQLAASGVTDRSPRQARDLAVSV